MSDPNIWPLTDMKKLSILGSTGSIGVNTLEIVAAYPDRFKVVALTAGYNLDLLLSQIAICHPDLVAVVEPESAAQLRKNARSGWPGNCLRS